MTSTKPAGHIGRYRREVEFQKLGPALIIASSLVLAIRTARWPPTQSDGLAKYGMGKGSRAQRPDREDCSFACHCTLPRDV